MSDIPEKLKTEFSKTARALLFAGGLFTSVGGVALYSGKANSGDHLPSTDVGNESVVVDKPDSQIDPTLKAMMQEARIEIVDGKAKFVRKEPVRRRDDFLLIYRQP